MTERSFASLVLEIIERGYELHISSSTNDLGKQHLLRIIERLNPEEINEIADGKRRPQQQIGIAFCVDETTPAPSYIVDKMFEDACHKLLNAIDENPSEVEDND